MKLGLILIGAMAGTLSLQASTGTLDLTDGGTSNAGYSVSPYTGNYNNGVTTTSIKLYCDDDADTWHGIGNTYNVTGVSVTESSPNTDERFASDPVTGFGGTFYNTTVGSSNLPPNATDLYEELAWLFTQMGDTTNGTILTDIQDAAWDLTSNNGSNQDAAAANWLKEAHNVWSSQPSGSFNDGSGNGSVTLTTATYSDWFVIDAAAGTTGSWQEFLTYSNSGSLGGGGSATPEPATFGLLGGALVFGGLFARRKSAK